MQRQKSCEDQLELQEFKVWNMVLCKRRFEVSFSEKIMR